MGCRREYGVSVEDAGKGVEKCFGVWERDRSRDGQYRDTCIGDTYRAILLYRYRLSVSLQYRYRLSMFLRIADASISILYLSTINLTRC